MFKRVKSRALHVVRQIGGGTMDLSPVCSSVDLVRIMSRHLRRMSYHTVSFRPTNRT